MVDEVTSSGRIQEDSASTEDSAWSHIKALNPELQVVASKIVEDSLAAGEFRPGRIINEDGYTAMMAATETLKELGFNG